MTLCICATVLLIPLLFACAPTLAPDDSQELRLMPKDLADRGRVVDDEDGRRLLRAGSTSLNPLRPSDAALSHFIELPAQLQTTISLEDRLEKGDFDLRLRR